VIGLLLVLAVAAPVRTEVRLVLKDGQVLEGVDVTRQGSHYHLELADGGIVPIPDELVERVVLAQARATEPSRPPDDGPPTGLTAAEPAELAGPGPVTPPRTSEQLRVLGQPSSFQPGIFDPNWHPESDWKQDPNDPHRNDFAPSEWADSIVDPEWQPQSAFPDDHTNFAPSTFQDNVIDPTWVPQDGFRKST
jgi:hypothetical protein